MEKIQRPLHIVSHEASPSVPLAMQYPKWFGGSASCLAVTVSHPLDLVKVRLQTIPWELRRGVLGTITQVVHSEGPSGLYRGLSAGLLRQLTYGSARFAIYEYAKEKVATQTGSPVSVGILLPAAAISGAAGAVVGNPADVANVRMQNDRSLPLHRRQNYGSVFDTLFRVVGKEGAAGLFRGVAPNAARAAAMTTCQLACYDGIKGALVADAGLRDGTTTQLLASLVAGLVATTVCSPMDVIKTRSMSSSSGGAQSILGMMRDLSRTEGLRWVFRGWLPSFARLGPHTAATLLLLEQHRRVYRELMAAKEDV